MIRTRTRLRGVVVGLFALGVAGPVLYTQPHQLVQSANATLHVINPLAGRGNILGVAVTMSVGSTAKIGTTGTTGIFTGTGFYGGDKRTDRLSAGRLR